MNKINKIAVVDIETTGSSLSQEDEIIQIGAVIIENKKVIAEHSMLLKPKREIPPLISQLTGITNKSVEDSPCFEQVAKLWYERLKDCVFVAHNLSLDLRFLKHYFKQSNLKFEPLAMDTVNLSKILLPTAEAYNLTQLSHYLSLKFDQAHDALSDAKVTSQILACLAREVKLLPTSTLLKIRPFVEALHTADILLFDQPEIFLIQIDSDKQEISQKLDYLENKAKVSVDYYETTANYIIEQTNRYLVIEDTQVPIDYHLALSLAQQLLKRDKKLLISLNQLINLSEWHEQIKGLSKGIEITELKHPRHFIHLKAFKSVVKNYDFTKYNQHELIVISATLVWLSMTKTGDYHELPNELNSYDLIQRLCNQHYLLKDHYYYQKML